MKKGTFNTILMGFFGMIYFIFLGCLIHYMWINELTYFERILSGCVIFGILYCTALIKDKTGV